MSSCNITQVGWILTNICPPLYLVSGCSHAPELCYQCSAQLSTDVNSHQPYQSVAPCAIVPWCPLCHSAVPTQPAEHFPLHMPTREGFHTYTPSQTMFSSELGKALLVCSYSIDNNVSQTGWHLNQDEVVKASYTWRWRSLMTIYFGNNKCHVRGRNSLM